jgi:hypothetical protein
MCCSKKRLDPQHFLVAKFVWHANGIQSRAVDNATRLDKGRLSTEILIAWIYEMTLKAFFDRQGVLDSCLTSVIEISLLLSSNWFENLSVSGVTGR